MRIGWVLPLVWAGLGAVIIVCSLRAARSRRAYLTGVSAVSVLWVVAGAAVNALFLARGDDYSGFANGASTSFVREPWQSVVVPHHDLFIGLLIGWGRELGRRALYAVTGWFALVPPSVTAMAVVMLAKGDPNASVATVVTLTVASLVFGAFAVHVYRPLLARR
jgi:hypothetical protein